MEVTTEKQNTISAQTEAIQTVDPLLIIYVQSKCNKEI